jgi:hypothetical protein
MEGVTMPRIQPIIPAQPGHYIITLDDHDPVVIGRREILAWLVTDDYLEPLTVYGISEGSYTILYPNGQVDVVEDTQYESIDEWVEEEVKRCKRLEGDLKCQ